MDKEIIKADEEVQKIHARKRLKSVEDNRVASEVFDKNTLETLYKLANQNYIDLLKGTISTGKEANVFIGIQDDETPVAVKIYRITTSDFRKMQYYIQGDPRFNIRTNNKRQLINAWTNKEFRNLTRAQEHNVKVPTPITSLNNVLIMEFIGDENGIPAPQLKQQPPQDPDEFLDKLLLNFKKFFIEAKLVHGDLSSYNILNHNEEPVIIDVSQAVTRDHVIARELLDRDISNLTKEFKRFGADVSEEYIQEKILYRPRK